MQTPPIYPCHKKHLSLILDDGSAVLQARVALRLPWWSLNTGFEAVRQMAGLQGDASGVHRALKEQTYAANGALPPGAMPAKDDRQVLQTQLLRPIITLWSFMSLKE